MPTEHRLHERCGCASLHVASAASGARPFAFPGTTRKFERPRPFRIDHLALDLALDIAQRRVVGAATLDVSRIDPAASELPLDAVGFDIRSVKVNGRTASFTYDGKMLTVRVGESVGTARIVVAYAATPRRGLYFLEPDEHVPGRPRQVWSQCQEEDARHWFPCHDKPHVKMSTEMVVHVPNGWSVLSNGELVSSEEPEQGAWKFHWKMKEPHPSYLVTLVAGEFALLADTAQVGDRTVPITYLVPKGREDDGRRTFARTPDMVTYFGDLLSVPYPWNKYAQVVVSDFIFGGMENTTATTMYEHILLDERAAIDVSSDDLISHELAHQWFGDFVTCRDWSEGWLNEGFATYMEHVWREKHLGRDEHDYGLRADLEAYLGEAHGRYRRPIVCQTYDAPLDLFDRHLYEKGGLALHVLCEEVGKTLFWRGVGLYLQRAAHGLVETRDLLRALESVSGRSLGKLFQQLVYEPGHPELEVKVEWEKGVLCVQVKQEQNTNDGVPAAFELTIDLDIVDEAGTVRRETLAVTQKAESFAVACQRRPAFVVVDPLMRVLGEVRLKVPNDMLRAQLERAKTARGRWLAAAALAKSDDALTIAALAKCVDNDEEFWGTRAQAAHALGKIRARECEAVLSKALSVAHPKVRRAVADALGAFKTTTALEALRPVALKDESYVVEAEAARALGRTKQPAAFETLVDLLERSSWFEVIRAGAIDGLAALRDDRAVAHVAARTRYGHPARARRAAILALPKIASDRKTRETLEHLLEDSDPIVRIDVARALHDLGDPKARPALRERLETDLDARVRRRIRETLRDLSEPRRGVEPLRDELEKLQGEHQELRARLAKLEARLGGGDEAKPAAKPAPKAGKPAVKAAPPAGSSGKGRRKPK
jgi:aminopeptidase N